MHSRLDDITAGTTLPIGRGAANNVEQGSKSGGAPEQESGLARQWQVEASRHPKSSSRLKLSVSGQPRTRRAAAARSRSRGHRAGQYVRSSRAGCRLRRSVMQSTLRNWPRNTRPKPKPKPKQPQPKPKRGSRTACSRSSEVGMAGRKGRKRASVASKTPMVVGSLALAMRLQCRRGCPRCDTCTSH